MKRLACIFSFIFVVFLFLIFFSKIIPFIDKSIVSTPLSFYLNSEKSSEIPKKEDGFVFDEAKTYCDSGASVKWDEEKWAPTIQNLTETKTHCNFYFKTAKLILFSEVDPALEITGGWSWKQDYFTAISGGNYGFRHQESYDTGVIKMYQTASQYQNSGDYGVRYTCSYNSNLNIDVTEFRKLYFHASVETNVVWTGGGGTLKVGSKVVSFYNKEKALYEIDLTELQGEQSLKISIDTGPYWRKVPTATVSFTIYDIWLEA